MAFLVLHVAASFYYISQHNVTYDEPDYIEYAKHWLHGHPERIQPLDDSKSPIVAVSWVPRIVRQIINPHYQLHDYGRKDQKEGRYMMILFSLITAFYVYCFCKNFYGARCWILPLLLLLFDPVYLANSTLITTDIATGTFLVALLYHFRKYLLHNSRKHFYLAAILTGLAIVTKQSLLFTLLLLPIISITYHTTTKTPVSINALRTLMNVGAFIIIIVIVINVLYYFKGSFTPFGAYAFESTTLRNLQQQFKWLHALPVPLPHSYVTSVDMLKAHADIGAGKPNSTFNGVYLLGELKMKGGYWYYYLVHLCYKMPIGILILFIASIVLFFKDFNLEGFSKKYLFIVVPIIFYFIILSFFNQFQNGIRHLLIIYPLMYIGLGHLLERALHASLKYKVVIAGAIIYSFISVYHYYPYIMPYTNELITDKKEVYKKLWDSSVDYGQSDSSIEQFIADHPEYKRATAVPDTGKFAVLMGETMNTYYRNANPYRWYQAFEPKGQYRYVVLLYDIKLSDLKNANWEKTKIKIISPPNSN